jgi:hypothetical protein
MGNLARIDDPTFISKPNDKLAAADAYRVNNNNVINNGSFQKAGSPVTNDILGLMGSKCMQAALTKANNPNAPMNVGSLLSTSDISRLAVGVAGPISNILRDLPQGAKDVLSGAMNIAAPVIATVGNLKGSVLSGNFGTANALSTVINTMTKSTPGNGISFSDPTGLVSSLSGVTGLASKVGLPNTFGPLMGSSLINGLPNARSLTSQIAGNSLGSVIGASDVKGLKAMGQLSIPGALNSYNPNTLKDFSTAYTSPVKDQTVLYGDEPEFADLNEAYDNVDPEWNKLKRQNAAGGTDEVQSVAHFSDASYDLKNVVKKKARESVITEERNYAYADAFGNVAPVSNLAQNNPQTVINSISSPTNDIGPGSNLVVYN